MLWYLAEKQEGRNDMGDIVMIPTREATIKTISDLSEQNYKKVALYVMNVTEKDEVASKEEVAALTRKFNHKYSQAFRALAL
jgi:hypothetical protein